MSVSRRRDFRQLARTPGECWRPILAGSIRDRALETSLSIARELNRKPYIRWNPRISISERRKLWLLLNTGAPSRILLLAYLVRTGLRPQARTQAERLFDEVLGALATTSLEPWLLKGYAGLAWLNQHLADLQFWSPGGNEEVDSRLLQLLERRWSGHFDLLYGLVGIGIYGLEGLPRSRACEIVARVVDQLERQAERKGKETTWLTPPDEIAFTPAGSYSLGMAHGVPAVIGFLARSHEAGIASRRARRLLEGAVPWLLRQRLPTGSLSRFPAWVYPGWTARPCRAAWCYGDPGVAAALYRSGQALQRSEWKRLAVSLMRRTAVLSLPGSGVRDATLCHGAAGLAHQLGRFWHATSEERFARAARRWYRRALGWRRGNRGIAGFQRFGKFHSAAEPVQGAAKGRWSSDPGFLTGAAGIALALLAAATSVEPAWDRLLLLDLEVKSIGSSAES